MYLSMYSTYIIIPFSIIPFSIHAFITQAAEEHSKLLKEQLDIESKTGLRVFGSSLVVTVMEVCTYMFRTSAALSRDPWNGHHSIEQQIAYSIDCAIQASAAQSVDCPYVHSFSTGRPRQTIPTTYSKQSEQSSLHYCTETQTLFQHRCASTLC